MLEFLLFLPLLYIACLLFDVAMRLGEHNRNIRKRDDYYFDMKNHREDMKDKYG